MGKKMKKKSIKAQCANFIGFLQYVATFIMSFLILRHKL